MHEHTYSLSHTHSDPSVITPKQERERRKKTKIRECQHFINTKTREGEEKKTQTKIRWDELNYKKKRQRQK